MSFPLNTTPQVTPSDRKYGPRYYNLYLYRRISLRSPPAAGARATGRDRTARAPLGWTAGREEKRIATPRCRRAEEKERALFRFYFTSVKRSKEQHTHGAQVRTSIISSHGDRGGGMTAGTFCVPNWKVNVKTEHVV